MIKKLGKYIWFQGEKWEVVEVYSPNPYDDYILIQKEDDITAHSSDCPHILMELIDAHNDEYYPNTPKVRELIGGIEDFKRKSKFSKIEKKLEEIWLNQSEDLWGDK